MELVSGFRGGALDKRCIRELQRQPQERAAQRGGILHATVGKGAERTMAATLQHRQAAQFARLQAARTGKHNFCGA